MIDIGRILSLIEEQAEVLNEKDYNDYIQGSGVITYIKEFRTINLGLPRRSGKTTFVKLNARPWSIIIVPNKNIKKFIYNEFTNAKVYSLEELESMYFKNDNYKGFIPEIIYLDEIQPSDTGVNLVYSMFAHHPDQKFIFINTPRVGKLNG